MRIKKIKKKLFVMGIQSQDQELLVNQFFELTNSQFAFNFSILFNFGATLGHHFE